MVMVVMMLAIVHLCTDVKSKQDLLRDKSRYFAGTLQRCVFSCPSGIGLRLRLVVVVVFSSNALLLVPLRWFYLFLEHPYSILFVFS